MRTGIWRHYKGGLYQVLGVGQHSETGEKLVIYVSLDVTKPGPRLFARPESMWHEEVEWPPHPGRQPLVDGPPLAPTRAPRFIFVGEDLS